MFWTIHILLHPLTSNDSNWKKSRLMVVCQIIRMTIMGSTPIALSATSISFWTYHVIMDLAMHPSFLSMLMQMVMILPFMPRYQEAYDWKKFRPFFGWQSEDVIANTFKHTTRNGSITFDQDTLKKHFRAAPCPPSSPLYSPQFESPMVVNHATNHLSLESCYNFVVFGCHKYPDILE